MAGRAGVAVGGDDPGGGSIIFDAGGGAIGFVEMEQEDGVRIFGCFGIAGFQLGGRGGIGVGNSVLFSRKVSVGIVSDGRVYDNRISAVGVVVYKPTS